jgi:hypothetical protein
MSPSAPSRAMPTELYRTEEIGWILNDMGLTENPGVIAMLEKLVEDQAKPDQAFAAIHNDDLRDVPTELVEKDRVFSVKAKAISQVPLSTESAPAWATEWIDQLVQPINNMGIWFSNGHTYLDRSIRQKRSLPESETSFQELVDAFVSAMHLFLEEESNLFSQLSDQSSEQIGQLSHWLEILADRLEQRAVKDFYPLKGIENHSIKTFTESVHTLQLATLTVANVLREVAQTTRVMATEKRHREIEDWAGPQRERFERFERFLRNIEKNQAVQRVTDTTRDRLVIALKSMLQTNSEAWLAEGMKREPSPAVMASPKTDHAMRDLQDLLRADNKRANLRVKNMIHRDPLSNNEVEWDLDIALEAIGLPRHGQSTDLPVRHEQHPDIGELLPSRTHAPAPAQPSQQDVYAQGL